MTNEEKIIEILDRHFGYHVNQGSDEWYTRNYQNRFADLLEMAEYKDSQPQIIEIFGKRVKIVEDTKVFGNCQMCAFSSKCEHIDVGSLCEDSSFNTNRHFVEVDEDGNEIK